MTSAETRQQRRANQRQERKGIAKPQKNAFARALKAFKERSEALKAAMILGPITMKLAMMDLAATLSLYRSRGHGKNAPSYAHGRGSRGGSWPKAHQSGQECLRRAVGGWAYVRRVTGMTKRQTLDFVAAQGRVPLERAVAVVNGLTTRPV